MFSEKSGKERAFYENRICDFNTLRRCCREKATAYKRSHTCCAVRTQRSFTVCAKHVCALGFYCATEGQRNDAGDSALVTHGTSYSSLCWAMAVVPNAATKKVRPVCRGVSWTDCADTPHHTTCYSSGGHGLRATSIGLRAGLV